MTEKPAAPEGCVYGPIEFGPSKAPLCWRERFVDSARVRYVYASTVLNPEENRWSGPALDSGMETLEYIKELSAKNDRLAAQRDRLVEGLVNLKYMDKQGLDNVLEMEKLIDALIAEVKND